MFPLDQIEMKFAFRCYETDCSAPLSSSASSANSVSKVTCRPGKVIVNYTFKALDVETATGEIGGKKYLDFSLA